MLKIHANAAQMKAIKGAAVAVINKRADLLAVSTLAVLVSIFLTVLMIVLCNDFKGADK